MILVKYFCDFIAYLQAGIYKYIVFQNMFHILIHSKMATDHSNVLPVVVVALPPEVLWLRELLPLARQSGWWGYSQ